MTNDGHLIELMQSGTIIREFIILQSVSFIQREKERKRSILFEYIFSEITSTKFAQNK